MDFESIVSAIPPRALTGVLPRIHPPEAPISALALVSPKLGVGSREGVARPQLGRNRKKGTGSISERTTGHYEVRY